MAFMARGVRRRARGPERRTWSSVAGCSRSARRRWPGILISRLLGGLQAPRARAARSPRSARGSCSTPRPTRSSRSTATAASPPGTRRRERMFGWTKDEAVGKTMRELIMPPEYARPARRAPPGAGRQHRPARHRDVRGGAGAPRRAPLPGRGHRVEGRGAAARCSPPASSRDTTERLRRQARARGAAARAGRARGGGAGGRDGRRHAGARGRRARRSAPSRASCATW